MVVMTNTLHGVMFVCVLFLCASSSYVWVIAMETE